jgi:D-alanine-D-alanine ligase
VARSSDAIGLYWSKAGAFFAVPPTIEASDFADGLPGHAEELHFRVGPHGGFMGSGRLGREKPKDLSAVIVATHGGPGEDGTLQGMLDAVGIPYSGPSVAGAALGMDKWAFGAVVAAAGLPTLPRVLLTSDLREVPFPGPYIVKPRFGGSSIGIEVVADLATAVARLSHNEHWSRGAVLEPYRDDLRDVQIALRTYPTLTLSAIEKPIRRTANAAILNYHDKYVGGEGRVRARCRPNRFLGKRLRVIRQ